MNKTRGDEFCPHPHSGLTVQLVIQAGTHWRVKKDTVRYYPGQQS